MPQPAASATAAATFGFALVVGGIGPTPAAAQPTPSPTHCGAGQFLGGWSELVCRPLHACTLGATYQTTAPTVTSDRICTRVTSCTIGTHYESAAATLTSDRLCDNAVTPCPAGSTYETAAATATSNTVCPAATQCELGRTYQTVAPTVTSDRACGAVTTCTAAGTWTSSPATLTSDAVCAPFSHCVVGVNYTTQQPTLTSDRICSGVTPCPVGDYISTPANEMSDNTCSRFTQCALNVTFETLSPTITSDRVCTTTTPCDPPVTALRATATLTRNFDCCIVVTCDQTTFVVPGSRGRCCSSSEMNATVPPVATVGGPGRTDGGTAAGGGVHGYADEDDDTIPDGVTDSPVGFTCLSNRILIGVAGASTANCSLWVGRLNTYALAQMRSVRGNASSQLPIFRCSTVTGRVYTYDHHQCQNAATSINQGRGKTTLRCVTWSNPEYSTTLASGITATAAAPDGAPDGGGIDDPDGGTSLAPTMAPMMATMAAATAATTTGPTGVSGVTTTLPPPTITYLASQTHGSCDQNAEILDEIVKPVSSGAAKKSDDGAVAGGIVGAVLLLGLVLGAAYYIASQNSESLEIAKEQLGGQELLLAEFSEEKERMLAAWQIPERDVNWGKRLAEGAYGEVWSARWAAHDVAIKILKKSLEDELYPEAEEDFKRECLTLQSIRHPHLLIFYGAGVTDGEIRPFMVTEFMMVGSLRTLLRNTDGVELSWEQRRTMAMQIGEGMQHLHSLKIVHRDLKSDNCLVGNDGDEFIIKVADFGNSRLLREQAEPEEEAPETAYDKLRKKRNMQTAYMNPLYDVDGFHGIPEDGSAAPNANRVRTSGMVPNPELDYAGAFEVDDVTSNDKLLMTGETDNDVDTNAAAWDMTMTRGVGTVLWMAPELFVGRTKYGPKVDVYSFGVILWELATRENPWSDVEAESYIEFYGYLCKALKAGDRPQISHKFAREHEQYTDLIRRCWATLPTERPSFDQIVTGFNRALNVGASGGKYAGFPGSSA